MQLIYDLAFALCVLVGYDPCDYIRSRPGWGDAVDRFAVAHRINGWDRTAWWLADGDTRRPSVVRDVWIEAAALPHVESLRPFAFQANGAWDEVMWARGAKEYVREVAMLHPHLEHRCDAWLTWLTHYHDAFYCLYLTQPCTTMTTYERRWHLQLLRNAIGDEAFRDGVMPGRIQP